MLPPTQQVIKSVLNGSEKFSVSYKHLVGLFGMQAEREDVEGCSQLPSGLDWTLQHHGQRTASVHPQQRFYIINTVNAFVYGFPKDPSDKPQPSHERMT